MKKSIWIGSLIVSVAALGLFFLLRPPSWIGPRPEKREGPTVEKMSKEEGHTHAPGEEDHHDEEEGQTTRVVLTEEAKRMVGLKTVSAEMRPLEDVITFSGVISADPNREAFVSPRVPGKVEAVYVTLGEEVTKGQKLLELRSVELENLQVELLQALTNFKLLGKDRARIEGLVEKRIVASKDLLKVQSDYEKAEREVEGIKRRLALLGLAEGEVDQIVRKETVSPLLPIPAPLGGHIVERNVTLGESVEPQQKLFRIIDLAQVLAEGDVTEDKLPRIKKGQTVRIRVNSFPGESFLGQIDYVSDRVEEEKRTVHVWSRLNNPQHKLKPGMFAELNVVAGKFIEALTVPLEAIISAEGENFAFVEEEGGFRRADLLLGVRNDRFAEVKNGLFPGDLVVTDGKRQVYTQYLAQSQGGAKLQGHTH